MALPNEIHPFAIAGGGNQYQVANSLRFRASNSAYLSRTVSGTGNEATYTWSGWVKRGSLGSQQVLFSAYALLNYETYFRFTSSDTLQFYNLWAETQSIITSQVFRDPSAWYHLVLAVNLVASPNTYSNCVKMYVNGVQITSFGTTTFSNVNTASAVNGPYSHAIGQAAAQNTNYFDGYIAEVNFIEGSQLDPSYFGQTDSITNQWVPKKYTGSYGTRGFYLPFNQSSVSGENDAYTAFLAHFNSFNDTSNSGKSITTYGTAAISSAQAKFGTGSLYVNAASQTSGNAYIRTASSSDFNIGAVSGNTNDFTLEFWYYPPNATNAWPYYPSLSIGDNTYTPLLIIGGSIYSSSDGSSWDIASGKVAGTPTPSAWNHYAISRSGSTWYAFINGAQQDTWTSSGTPQALSSYLQIGRSQGGSNYSNGYFDEVRWSKGVARYTANFTVPSGPFTGGIGYDAANDCHWSPSGISVTSGSTYDVMIDSPTNYNDGGNNRGNYCTLNPLTKSTTSNAPTPSEGNLNFVTPSGVNTSGWPLALGTIAVNSGSGKWYFEVDISGLETDSIIAFGWSQISIINDSDNSDQLDKIIGALIRNDSVSTGLRSAILGTYVTRDGADATDATYQIALDNTDGKIWIGKNNTWYASGNPSQGTSEIGTFTTQTLIPVIMVQKGNTTSDSSSALNFGQRPFTYTPPAGYKALNSYNLANPSLPLV